MQLDQPNATTMTTTATILLIIMAVAMSRIVGIRVENSGTTIRAHPRDAIVREAVEVSVAVAVVILNVVNHDDNRMTFLLPEKDSNKKISL